MYLRLSFKFIVRALLIMAPSKGHAASANDLKEPLIVQVTSRNTPSSKLIKIPHLLHYLPHE